MCSFKLGIDIGGTFTDFNLIDVETGASLSFKVSSTPRRPALAVKNGLERLKYNMGIDPNSIEYFIHGSTIAVNTLIQRNGANLCLFVTVGFSDVLDIQRLRMPNVFDLGATRTESLIPRERCMQIQERIGSDGTILTPLDRGSVVAAIEKALMEKVDGVVVCFLNSYRNAEHELVVRDMILEHAPQLDVSCSAEVWPEIREYERAIVAVVNAYLLPKTKSYLIELEEIAKAARIQAMPYITKSNGGIMNIQQARKRAVETLLSGPASGVVGASYVAGLAGYDNVITLDMGGTSTDISLINGGKPGYSTEDYVGEFPIIIPVVAVSCIGAGGSSIAWVDGSNVLKVGPDSVGADPGPACYDRGGNQPTVTDAYLVCGFINATNFSGGEIKLRTDLSENAIGSLATRINLDLYAAAQAIIDVSTANMYKGLNSLLSRSGVDPRSYTLLPFGGAGPTHLSFIAREFNLERVVVPPTPGTLSAFGALCADVKAEFIKSIGSRTTEVTVCQLKKDFGILKEQAFKYMSEERFSANELFLYLAVDMNYVGQSFQVEVLVEEDWLFSNQMAHIENAFHRNHHRIYGHSDDSAATEIMNLRVTIVGTVPKPKLKKLSRASHKAKPVSSRRIYYDQTSWVADVYHRKDLGWGDSIAGPAIVEQDDSTVVILHTFTGKVDQYGNIVITKKGRGKHVNRKGDS